MDERTKRFKDTGIFQYKGRFYKVGKAYKSLPSDIQNSFKDYYKELNEEKFSLSKNLYRDEKGRIQSKNKKEEKPREKKPEKVIQKVQSRNKRIYKEDGTFTIKTYTKIKYLYEDGQIASEAMFKKYAKSINSDIPVLTDSVFHQSFKTDLINQINEGKLVKVLINGKTIVVNKDNISEIISSYNKAINSVYKSSKKKKQGSSPVLLVKRDEFNNDSIRYNLDSAFNKTNELRKLNLNNFFNL